jgi:hypothetical protein
VRHHVALARLAPVFGPHAHSTASLCGGGVPCPNSSGFVPASSTLAAPSVGASRSVVPSPNGQSGPHVAWSPRMGKVRSQSVSHANTWSGPRSSAALRAHALCHDMSQCRVMRTRAQLGDLSAVLTPLSPTIMATVICVVKPILSKTALCDIQTISCATSFPVLPKLPSLANFLQSLPFWIATAASMPTTPTATTSSKPPSQCLRQRRLTPHASRATATFGVGDIPRRAAMSTATTAMAAATLCTPSTPRQLQHINSNHNDIDTLNNNNSGTDTFDHGSTDIVPLAHPLLSVPPARQRAW